MTWLVLNVDRLTGGTGGNTRVNRDSIRYKILSTLLNPLFLDGVGEWNSESTPREIALYIHQKFPDKLLRTFISGFGNDIFDTERVLPIKRELMSILDSAKGK